jgi:hypothetical protein
LFRRFTRLLAMTPSVFAVSFVESSQRSTLGTVDKVILDAAHDASAIYEFLIHHQPTIYLNVRTNESVTKGDIHISLQGIPVCPVGLDMKCNGYDQARYRINGVVLGFRDYHFF